MHKLASLLSVFALTVTLAMNFALSNPVGATQQVANISDFNAYIRPYAQI